MDMENVIIMVIHAHHARCENGMVTQRIVSKHIG